MTSNMRWTRRLQLSLLLPTMMMTALMTSASAWAVTSFDFVSSGGQFAIANNSIDFGTGITISAASDDGSADATLVSTSILLDDIGLTGIVESLAPGVARVGVALGQQLELQIFETPGNGGALLATASYDPGEFIVIGASAILSGPVAPGLTNLVLTQAGQESAVLSALLASPFAIDFNATLSAAGQDIAQRIAMGALVTGAVAGSVATTTVPEPTTALLMGLGLGGLGFSARRARIVGSSV